MEVSPFTSHEELNKSVQTYCVPTVDVIKGNEDFGRPTFIESISIVNSTETVDYLLMNNGSPMAYIHFDNGVFKFKTLFPIICGACNLFRINAPREVQFKLHQWEDNSRNPYQNYMHRLLISNDLKWYVNDDAPQVGEYTFDRLCIRNLYQA
jgi:hypothetical protein